MNPTEDHGGTPSAGRDVLLRLFPVAAGMVATVFGLLTLLGWGFGWPLLASFGAERIPMAPSTAALFLLHGMAIWLRARAPWSIAFRWGSGAIVGLATVFALLLFALGWLDIQWAGEHLGLNLTETVGGAPIGHMSPITASCFLLSSVSFLASLSPSAIPSWRAVLALISAGMLLCVAYVFLLAYSFGTPLLYGSPFIPPALNTILAFVALGLALLALVRRPDGRPRKLPTEHSSPAFGFIIIFLVLVIGIIAGGYSYYRYVEQQYRTEVRKQLTAIADLKVGELTQYRKERLSDGAILHHNPVITDLVRRFLGPTADTDAQHQLLTWIDKYHTQFQYEQIRLLDTEGVTRLASVNDLPAASSVITRSASEALRTDQVAFQDFYRGEHDQRIYLAVLVPILDESDDNKPLGVLVLRIDPETYLYPFISRWPVLSDTAETLLIRREGDEAVFLNELRFQRNTALTLRVPLTTTSLPAVKGVLGQQGLVEGLDYRGVPVLAGVRAVPDSPWFLVARRDQSEIFLPLKAQFWQVISLVTVLLLGAAAGLALVWRQQHIRIYRERADAGEALWHTQALLGQAERIGRVGGWEIDIETGQLTWTDGVYDIHEFDRTAPLTVEQSISFYAPESRPIIEQAVQRAIEQGEPFNVELEIITAKGHRRSVNAEGLADLPHGKITGFFQDITERKQVEQDLRQSKEKFQVIFEQAPLGIGVIDSRTGQIIQANSKYSNIVGRTVEQMETIDWMGLTHPEDVQEDLDNMALLNAGEIEGYQMDKRYIRPDGTLVWVSMSVKSLHEEGRLHPRHLAIVEDITQRRQTEEILRQSRRAALNIMTDAIEARERLEQASKELVSTLEDQRRTEETLRESEARFRRAVTGAPFPIMIHAEDGQVITVNTPWTQLTGYEHSDIPTIADWTRKAYGVQMDPVRAYIEGLYALDGPKAEGEYTITTSSGDSLVWDFSSAPIGQLPDGQRLVISMAMDVTGRKKIEAERKKFFQLAESSSEFIGMCDLDMNPLYVNPAGRRMVGHPDMAAACRVKVQDYFFPEDQQFIAEEFFPRVLRDGHGDVEIRLRHFRTGKPIWMFYYLFSIHDDAGTPIGWAAISRDITERRQTQEALHKLNTELEQRVRERTAQLEAANKELEAFSYSVSHDLRAPLRHISGYVELLESRFQEALPEKARYYLHQVTDSARQMGTLIDELLQFSRTSRQDLQRADIEMNAVVQEALEMLKPDTEGRNISWTVGELPRIYGDHSLLKQVWINLLGNAVKYTRYKDDAEIVIGCARESDHWVFCVRDNGVGFDIRYVHKLFGVFQRLHSSAQFEGTGIGLANVQRIVHKHGGRVWAEGQLNEGAAFYFTIPESTFDEGGESWSN